MKFSEELQARGFINQFSAETLGEILDGEKRVVYHGIDPTADSAHAGNFVVWMLLRHLAKEGHKVVFLVGGGTGMIGDPKPDSERTLSSLEEVKYRVEKLQQQAKKILNNDSIEFVNNYDWLSKLDLISFLRDIGKNFTINELIKKEAIAKRLNSDTGLSYTEFAYPLLQAYDYLKLFQEKNCTLQVGGSDQWGNMVAGIDLIRRVEGKVAHVVTVPMIVDKTTGKKFGKSEGNAVWLDAEKTSPYKFYQFWFNVSDENVIDYLKLFSLLSLGEIEVIATESNNDPSARKAQVVLAREVTTLVHGEELARRVEMVSRVLFGEELINSLDKEGVQLLKENAPFYSAEGEVDLVEVLVGSGLASSKREAREFIENGAIFINGEKQTDLEFKLSKDKDGELLHLRRGKKNVVVVELK